MSEAVFVDTSGFYAAFDADDAHHGEAAAAFSALLDGIAAADLEALTHGSVIVETSALVQRRLGMAAVRVFLDDVVPLCSTVWVDADLHREAVTAMLAAGRRSVSLVDWTSFVVMRRHSVDRVLAFDEDFSAQGFARFRA